MGSLLGDGPGRPLAEHLGRSAVGEGPGRPRVGTWWDSRRARARVAPSRMIRVAPSHGGGRVPGGARRPWGCSGVSRGPTGAVSRSPPPPLPAVGGGGEVAPPLPGPREGRRGGVGGRRRGREGVPGGRWRRRGGSPHFDPTLPSDNSTISHCPYLVTFQPDSLFRPSPGVGLRRRRGGRRRGPRGVGGRRRAPGAAAW